MSAHPQQEAQHVRVKRVLADALAQPADLRRDFVRNHPDLASHPAAQNEVLQLLAAREAASQILPDQANLLAAIRPADRTGKTVGNYELLEPVGHGGSATVYRARATTGPATGRTVALKLLDRGGSAATGRNFQRFQREVQVLAQCEHPYIARLYEAGQAPDGAAYIVMEFVEGLPLDQYVRNQPAELRLTLFLKIAEAVAVAHRNLIVHRDLKPSNILVTPQGDPRLLDFGIARLLITPGGEEGRENRLTETGHDRMTMQYASPEQIRREDRITTQSDLYSLGVVLYEMLCEQSPYGDTKFPYEVAARIASGDIRRPPRDRRIDADLEAILLKAMALEPGRRYRSADDMADDVRRFLAREPVLAQRQSIWYRARKFLVRNRLPVALAIIALVLLAGLAFMLERQRRLAEQNLRRALALANTVNLRNGHVRNQTGTGALKQARAAKALFDALLVSNPQNDDVRRMLRGQLFNIGTMLAHPAHQNIGDTDGALESFRDAAEIAAFLKDRKNPHWEDEPVYVDIRLAIGSVLIEQGRYPEARVEFEDALRSCRETPNRTPEERRISNTYAEALAHLSRVSLHENNQQECLRLRRQALEIRRRILSGQPDYRDYKFSVAGTLALYGWALREFRHTPQALAAYDESIRIVTSAGGRVDATDMFYAPLLARNYYERGRVHLQLQKPAEARKDFEQSVELFRRIQVVEPDSVSNQRSLALALAHLASLSAPRSRELASEALQLAEAAWKVDPKNQKAAEDLAKVRSLVRDLTTAPK